MPTKNTTFTRPAKMYIINGQFHGWKMCLVNDIHLLNASIMRCQNRAERMKYCYKNDLHIFVTLIFRRGSQSSFIYNVKIEC